MSIFITESDVRSVVGPREAFEAVKDAHIDIANGYVDNVVRSRARSSQMSLHTLSAISTKLGIGAAKVYSAGRNAINSFILLFELRSAKLLATIEANELGKLRTAAASMLSTQLMLEKLPLCVSLIGTGFQAWGIAESVAYFSLDKSKQRLLVYSRNEKNRNTFVEQVQQKLGVLAISSNCAEETVRGSEVLFTATTSSSPVFERDWLKTTRHISALGSNALTRQEVPPHAVSAARLVFVDCKETAHKEGGNLIKAIENGKLLWSQVRELSDIVCDPQLFRAQFKTTPNSNEVGFSIFSSQGLAVQDLYLAKRVFDQFATNIPQ